MIKTTTRNRFIFLAISVYVVFAMLWTFLSGKLFEKYTESNQLLAFMASLSIVFVLGSVAWFFLTLKAVPMQDSASRASFIDTLAFRGGPVRWPRWAANLFALVISLAVLLAGQYFLQESQAQAVMHLFMPAILISALVGGVWPGLTATAVVSLGADLTVLKPIASLRIDSGHELFTWAVLIASGIAISLTCEVLRRALSKEAVQRRLVDAVVSNSHDAVFIKDREGRYLVANDAIADIVGLSREAIVGRDDSALFDERSARQMNAVDQDILHGAKTRVVHEQICTRDGRALDVEVVKGPLLDAWGEISGVFGMVRASPATPADTALALANFDPVTGLPSAELLHDRLIQFLARATRDGSGLAVCSVGLAGTDLIAPRLGQPVAERLLQGIARNLAQSLRGDDTLASTGPNGMVVLLSDVGTVEDCVPLLTRLCQAASAPVPVDSHHLSATVYIGVTLYPLDASPAPALLAHAEQAMQQARHAAPQRAGRAFQFYDALSDQRAEQRYALREQLQAALSRDQLVLQYLPRIDLINGAVNAVDAQVLWQGAGANALTSAEILLHVRGGELELAFEQWLLQSALSQLAQWQAQQLDMTLCIQLSVHSLLRPDFLGVLQHLLSAYPQPLAGRLVIELGEAQTQKQAQKHDAVPLVSALQALRALGIHILLCAFGSGPASLTGVQRLPVDGLKLDAAIVHKLLDNAGEQALVESIVSLAGATGLQLVAEGVETLAHGAALVRVGCRFGQGAAIAGPMAAPDFERWLARWRRGDMPWARAEPVPPSRLLPDYPLAQDALRA